MKKLQFIQLRKDSDSHRAEFKSLYWDFNDELCEHNPSLLVSPNPHYTAEEFRLKCFEGSFAMLDDSDRHLELCYDGENLIGFLEGVVEHEHFVGFIKRGWGCVREFYVKPEHRRKGYGRAMAGRLEALFAADGAKMMYLNADEVTGVPFWTAMGFTETDEINTDCGKPIWVKRIALCVTPLTAADIPFIIHILTSPRNKAALHPVELSFADWKAAFEQNLADPDEANFVIRQGETPVAWLKLNGLSGSGTAGISMLVVHENYQRQGVGSFALRYAEDYVRDMGFTALGIKTTADNAAALACYKKAGYVITGEHMGAVGDGVVRKGYSLAKQLGVAEK
jgi:GNAT superfamily N-acetyltransferase